jgi:hypothetical protein
VHGAQLAARVVLAVAAGLLTSLGTMTARCDDRGGVPSWERCQSWLGNPIIEWPGGNFSPLFALAIGLGIGYLVWWLLGRSRNVALVTTAVVVIGVIIGLAPLVVSIFTA